MTLITWITRIATFMTSTFAIPFYGAAFAIAGIKSAGAESLRPLGWTAFGAAITFAALWAVTFFYG